MQMFYNMVMNILLKDSDPDPEVWKMCVNYFESHRSGGHDTMQVTKYLDKNYKFASKRKKYGKNILLVLRKDVASALNDLNKDEHLIPHKNFTRIKSKRGYLYSYLPKTTSNILDETTNNKPFQTALDFEAPDEQETPLELPKTEEDNSEETTSETSSIMQDNSPLFEDVQAAFKINGAIEMAIDETKKIILHGLDDCNFSITKNRDKITIEISN